MRPLALLIAAALTAGAAAQDSFVLRGVTIHRVTAPAIENAMLLVRDGKIAELGPKIQVPKGAREFPAKGLHVYPGMIDSSTQIGLYEIGSIRETADSTEIGDFNPQLRAAIAVNAGSEHIPVTRSNGITTVLTAPQGGIISGQAAMIHLNGWTWEEMVIAKSAALVLRFPSVSGISAPPATGPSRPRIAFPEAKRRYDTQLRELYEFVEQARRYQRARGSVPVDLKFEAMVPVLEGKLPVLLHASNDRTIKEALQFVEKEKIKVILADVREPGDTLDQIKAKGIPVVLGKVYALPPQEDDPYDEAFTLPARLHAAGVKFAFGAFDAAFVRNTPFNAAAAVAFGLPKEEALKAVTINAAEIFGLADQIGSIDPGKWADLILTDGDPLETRTQIKQVFIKGVAVDIENKHTRLYQKYLNRP